MLNNTRTFGSDEGDNITGGYVVSLGGQVYNDFYSQHTPFTYWATASLIKLGAKNTAELRLFFSILILLICAFLHRRYFKTAGSLPFLLLLIIYPLSATDHFGHMILADVFSGFAILTLYLEAQDIEKTKITSLNIKQSILITLGLAIALMSTFVSIFALFSSILLIGFILLRNNKFNFYKTCHGIKISIFSITLFFSFIIFYFFITNNLNNAIYQAYTFNREVYQKYHGSLSQPHFLFFELPLNYFLHFWQLLSTWVRNPTSAYSNIYDFTFLGGFLFLTNQFFKKKLLLAFGSFIILSYTAIRGFTGFHSLSFLILNIFFLGMLLNTVIQKLLNFSQLPVQLKLANILFIFWMSLFCIRQTGEFLKWHTPLNSFAKQNFSNSEYMDYVLRYTTDHDTIWTGNLDGYIYFQSKRLPGSRIWSLVPWFAEIWQDQLIKDLTINKTKLIIYDPNYMTWNYKISNYAPLLDQFIKTNYDVLNTSNKLEQNIYLLKKPSRN
jgi:hypothetical protein